MSCSYADGLSPYENKGILGLDEKYESAETLRLKCGLLAEWIESARHVVVHTGAGISTAAGIPDFRGPMGVWTLEQKGLKPEKSVSFNDAIPTKTHMALKTLIENQKVKFIISQNIDGLHLRSGIPRQNLSELHGNMFVEQCDKCGKQFIRNFATTSVGKKSLDTVCRSELTGGRPCRGRMHDTILDWEHNLPDNDLTLSDLHSSVADLSICLGTTLQIIPSGNLPLYTKKYGGRLVICNLQPTKHDKKADLVINGNVEDIITNVMKKIGLDIALYSTDIDPTRNTDLSSIEMDWTIPSSRIKEMKVLYKKVCKPTKRKRKTFMYEREKIDLPKPTKSRKQLIQLKVESKSECNERIPNKNESVNDFTECNTNIKEEDDRNLEAKSKCSIHDINIKQESLTNNEEEISND